MERKGNCMHESAIVESMLAIVLRHARQANALRVTGVHLVLGEFSHETDEALQFYWDSVSVGTIAQGATLRFERAPLEMRCADCGHVFSPSKDAADCPVCLGRRVAPLRGDQVRVDSIDVE